MPTARVNENDPTDPTAEDSAMAQELFDAAAKLSPEEREAFLGETCGRGTALRLKIEQMLEAETKGQLPSGFPFSGVREGRLGMGQEGDSIGRYKLLQKIGEGGFGEVWMAEQKEPVKRRVALKIIKLGMDTRQVVARFEAERQALALMDHPNIAKVFDGGATENGRPYFVMELVKGVPITEYCETHNIGTDERLKLFIQVCQAIQHAHQKGIIHRDIKPSNILVSIQDGIPVPKVIDFGIAKATQQQLTDKTLYTQLQQFIGTPAYMSPEQAEMTSIDIDTRTDIYSLGVLLYELLTGATPFDTGELLKSGLDEMRKIIRQKDPPRPSTRLRQTAALSSKPHLANLHALLSTDLDWIVMKCLEKDRMRRYETGNALAADIARFLRYEPITARPPGNLYRFGKLLRRHKVAFGAGTAVAVALALAGAALALAFKMARRQLSAAGPLAKRMAVLPFKNTDRDHIPDYIPESVTTELINSLRKAPGLIAFRTPASFGNDRADEICALLHPSDIPFLVEGSVESDRGRIKVIARLVKTADVTELASGKFECEPKRLLGFPNNLAIEIAEHSVGFLRTEVRNAIASAPTSQPEAYDSFLRGRYELLDKLGRERTNAIPLLERAIEYDPRFALAYAHLSQAYVVDYFYYRPEEAPRLEPMAERAFSRALELNTNLAEGHFAKGFYFWTPSQHWQWDKAVSEERRALELNPQALEISNELFLALSHAGLFEEVHRLIAEARKSNPLNSFTQSIEANALFCQGKDAEAVRIWGTSSNSMITSLIMNANRSVALINLGRTNEVQGVIASALRADPEDTGGVFESVLAILRAKQADEQGARQMIAAALAKRKGFGHFHHTLYNLAAAYALLNQPEKALSFLEETADDGFPCYPFFQADVNLNNLRTNREFKAFLTDQGTKYEKFKAQFASMGPNGH